MSAEILSIENIFRSQRHFVQQMEYTPLLSETPLRTEIKSFSGKDFFADLALEDIYNMKFAIKKIDKRSKLTIRHSLPHIFSVSRIFKTNFSS